MCAPQLDPRFLHLHRFLRQLHRQAPHARPPRCRRDFDEFKQFINRRDKVGISQSREFCGSYDTSFKDQLLKLYDPKKVAPKFHPLYTLKALCKRESLKFDPSIRRHLNVLWKEIDEDKSGRIEYDEYVPMHRRCCEIMVSLTKIEVESISGKKVNVGTGLPPKLLTRDGRINHEEHEKLAQEDWEIDNGGMGFLDYERFVELVEHLRRDAVAHLSQSSRPQLQQS